MNWYITVLTRYADFTGRARRAEYWMFTLFSVIVSIVLAAADALVFGTGSFTSLGGGFSASYTSIGVLSTVYALAVLLPTLGVTARRLHDTDRSGWWMLLGFVPIVGGIVLLVLLALDGTRGPNGHGSDPKGVPAHPGYPGY
jgi:uncharacterized membrane protein YhaH (DUF805 family)